MAKLKQSGLHTHRYKFDTIYHFTQKQVEESFCDSSALLCLRDFLRTVEIDY